MSSCRCRHRGNVVHEHAHDQAPHDFQPFPGDWKWNAETLLEAAVAALKLVHVDTSHDIPYVAGYSQDGSKVYLDKHMCKKFTDSKNNEIAVDTPLAMHELTEKLYEGLGLPYQLAHQIALRVERALVEAHGVNWEEYNAFMDKWVAEIGAEHVQNPPNDLDLEPYVDEGDEQELARICLHR